MEESDRLRAIEDLRRTVRKLDWWHRIDLGDGIVTPGRDDSEAKLARLELPDSLDGKRVLDIGAWDGFFSFEAERRGASVVAMDLLAWQRGERSGRPCFELARRVLGSSVQDVTLDVMNLSRDQVGDFDVVLCLGVLYHLRDPLGALERIAEVTREKLILETHTDGSRAGRPTMTFYPRDELNADPSNWWGANEPALRAFLYDVGFQRVRVVYRRPIWERLGYAAVRLRKFRAPLWNSLRHGRIVLHADKRLDPG